MKKVYTALTLCSALLLGACSERDEIVVSSDIADITKEDLYNEMLDIAGPSLLEQIVTKQLLEESYSVTDEQVDEEFEALKASYGETFNDTLVANGMTEESLRNNIYFSLLRENAEKESGKPFDELMQELLEQENIQIEIEELQHVFDKYTAEPAAE